MSLVSIILPTCDRGVQLARAVASVMAQSDRDWELLVIDNNRRERPLVDQLATAIWRADPRVRVLRPDRMHNAAVARNVGLDAARGTWISYLDDDDAYRPTKIARQRALAQASRASVVLCGATFHLRGRTRAVQCGRPLWQDDELILQARWNTPLLFHPHPGRVRFDESLSPGEDTEFAHRLIANAGASSVPVAVEPLVDIFPQPGPRVNANPAPVRSSVARILALRPGFFSRPARRRYVLQALLTVAKLSRQPGRCAALGCRLFWESGGADWRPCANALVVSLGIFRDRWVS